MVYVGIWDIPHLQRSVLHTSRRSIPLRYGFFTVYALASRPREQSLHFFEGLREIADAKVWRRPGAGRKYQSPGQQDEFCIDDRKASTLERYCKYDPKQSGDRRSEAEGDAYCPFTPRYCACREHDHLQPEAGLDVDPAGRGNTPYLDLLAPAPISINTHLILISKRGTDDTYDMISPPLRTAITD